MSLLFEKSAYQENPIELSIEEAAKTAGVSTATIRNWLKIGDIQATNRGWVKAESLSHYMQKTFGEQKLSNRANKSQKDYHDHQKLTKHIEHSLQQLNRRAAVYPELLESYGLLGIEYEQALSNSYRNKEGIYYTPEAIVSDLFQITATDLSNKYFCDPCCGSGNFLIRALEIGFPPQNIYGFDLDPIAVKISQKRVETITGYPTTNIVQKNFLQYTIENQSEMLHKFDYIFTNPPWGKKLNKQEREYYSYIPDSKTAETCSLFFFASLLCLKNDGILGLLLPESFFHVASFQNIRQKALSLEILRLVDYGKVFAGLITKAQAIVLRLHSPEAKHNISCQVKNQNFYRLQKSFQKNPKTIINLTCRPTEAKTIEHIYAQEHITLSGTWGLGIVTGNNRRFIQSKYQEGLIPVYKGSDLAPGAVKNTIKEASSFIPNNLSLYQQASSKTLYEAPRKLIYKFISNKLCFFYDDQQRYLLNSANMFIPNCNFPIHCQQLTDILNSHIITWLFQKIFTTYKVLRGDLETLPIHIAYFQHYDQFNETNFLNFLGIERTNDGTYRIKR